MELQKKALSIILITIIMTITLIDNTKNKVYAAMESPIKAGVFLSTFDDEYLSLVKQNLEDIQKENPRRIEFTFYNADGNQGRQNESIDRALNEDIDLAIVVLVNAEIKSIEDIFNEINKKNVPLILYMDPTPAIINLVKSYNRAVIIGTFPEQSGILQGKVLVNEWNKNKKFIDKNGDDTLQYVLLHGETYNPTAIARTKASIETINSDGIKTERLGLKYCNWNRECARAETESLLLMYGNKIEAIIANNDAMAIGAIDALKNYGYFKGNKSNYIPVIGIDAIPEARELIKEGFITGTVIQDSRAAADAIYTIGINLVSGGDPLRGTNYKFDNTGIVVRLPYYEYKPE